MAVGYNPFTLRLFIIRCNSLLQTGDMREASII